MWTKQNKLPASKILLLLVILLVVGVIILGCAGTGAQPRGWSGVMRADGTLFLGSMEGKLVAVHTSSGTRLWEAILETSAPATGGFGCATSSTTVAIYGTPVVARGLVYVGGYNGKIYAINSSSGLSKWEYLNEGNPQPIVGGAIVALDMVYIASSDGKVYALDAATLNKEWEFPTGDKIWSTPTIDGDTLYIGSFDKKLYALNATDGTKRWEFETEGAIASTPLVYDNTVYIGSFDRHLYAVDTADGSLRWKFMAENWFWAKPVIHNNTIYAGCLDGKVYAVDVNNGDRIDEFDLGSPISSSPVLVDSSIAIASEDGQVYTIDTGSNQERLLADVKKLAGEELTIRAPLSTSDGVLYVHAQTKKHGSLLYALNAETGVVLWSLSLSSK